MTQVSREQTLLPKRSPGEFALFGGARLLPRDLFVGRPNVGDRQRLLARFNDMLDRRWLTNNGPLVREFEARLQQYLGVKHCIAMCNATIALEIAIRAAGLQGEVIVPSFTFVATAHALQWQQVTPVFCDVDPATHNIDPARVEELVTPRTTGIIGVHVWGRPCDVEALQAIADRHRLTLMFDAAHAFGCSHHGRMIGQFGLAEVFSFHATKFFNSFEGGALATNDDELAARARLMTNFGFAGYDEVVYVGTNGKMTEPSAAMGLTSFESLDEFIAVNRANYDVYAEALAGVPGVTLCRYDPAERNNFHYVVIEIDAAAAGLTRDVLQRVLWAEGVLARRYFYPACHRMEPYRSYFPHSHLLLAQTEALVGRVMSLPNGTGVTVEEIRWVCDLIALAVKESGDVNARYAALQD